MRRVIIVGAGASGLVAAITAARAGAQVTVLEQNERPGKKLLATGNGRCNMTNLEQFPEAYRGTHPAFPAAALHRFDVKETLRFFSELGIYTVNKNGYIYPHSGQAASVVDVLCMEAASLGIKLKNNEKVISLTHKNPSGRGSSPWKVKTQTWSYEADAVILAGGSKASAISGADGSCYDLAKALGHPVIPPMPALTGLTCGGKSFAKWSGVRTEGRVTTYIDGKQQESAKGELQLTEYGISGIPVFQVSRNVIRALAEGHSASVRLDFLPDYDLDGLTDFLRRRRENCPYKNERQMLVGLFPDKLIRVLCDYSEKKKVKLEEVIKEFHLEISGGLSFTRAQICSGGVDTAQVVPETMESRLHRGLFFAGELLDVDGICGGYNLQWAWSSGVCAGGHAAKDSR